ncbi:hypothetical protein [Rubidibacter lacunae]|uniref:hypothetical protein n=1 Tax=Rubidibacter lacunae TaxID=582514 RepID=UPI0012EC5F5A|nr:hypothetical protein [Rubidibacter lacunae]
MVDKVVRSECSYTLTGLQATSPLPIGDRHARTDLPGNRFGGDRATEPEPIQGAHSEFGVVVPLDC